MPLDFSHDGLEHLFRQSLRDGINLFCGAGFSVESFDTRGRKLPVGKDLLNELKEVFPDIEALSNLPFACTTLLRTDKRSFNDFMRNRFTVGNYDKSYEALRNVRIRNIYTTNIDDLVFKIFENDPTGRYINNCARTGSSYRDLDAIGYYPLHGCVRDGDDYVFGATELASAFSKRGMQSSWRDLQRDASQEPILFWGWNFRDPAPLQAMYGQGGDIDNNALRWVLLRNPDAEALAVCRALRINVIVGDTRMMLEYIADTMREDASGTMLGDFEKSRSDFSQWEPPKNDDQLPSFPLKSMFLEYLPRWSHIYSGMLPKTSSYRKVAESIASSMDTFVYGMRCSGKSTIMMQLLADYRCKRPKHFLVAPSLSQVKRYLSQLGKSQSLVFVDDCFRDTDAVIALLRAKNVQAVCFDRDFCYEAQYFAIAPYEFNSVDVTEIRMEDAQAIIDIIPEEIKWAGAKTKGLENDPTIVNLLAKTLKTGSFTFMQSFSREDRDAARVFLMVAYVQACGVPCSFDMVYSFLGDTEYTYQEMQDIIFRAGGLLKEAVSSETYDIREGIQDYYQCSSRFLAERIIENVPDGNDLFTEVLEDFVEYVPTYKICSYDLFKRSGYDADFSQRAFPNIDRGEQFYLVAESKDTSEYLYQQAALYCLRLGFYKKAFAWIERAKNLAHINRFSIQSTYARIFFEVNIDSDKELAAKALDQIHDCCVNDKRKSIHFILYAECCLRYYSVHHDGSYLKSALRYVEEGLDMSNKSLGTRNKKRLRQLERRLKRRIGDMEVA